MNVYTNENLKSVFTKEQLIALEKGLLNEDKKTFVNYIFATFCGKQILDLVNWIEEK